MKKIKLDTSLEKKNQSINNTSIMEDKNNEVKVEDGLLIFSVTDDYEKLPEQIFDCGMPVEAGYLRQPDIFTRSDETLLHVLQNKFMCNTPIMKDNNEVKVEDILLKSSVTDDYEKLPELFNFGIPIPVEAGPIPVEAGYLRQPEIFTRNEETLLHIAARYGYVDSIEMLINHGANPEARDKDGCTALHLATEKGHYLCVKKLLEAGADCSVPIDKNSYSLTGMAYTKGTTALHLASTYNHVNCVELLIQFGANCEAVDIDGHTSLNIAAKAGYSECVLTHLRHAHDSSFLSLPSYVISSTPLHFAVKNGMVECVKQLVHSGSNVNHMNMYGFSPLHFACHTDILLPKHIRMQILKILVLESHNTDMSYAFHGNLFDKCDSEAKLFLITYGADINVKNEMSGLTLLEHELIRPRNFEVMKCIVNSMLQVPHLNSLDVHPIWYRDMSFESLVVFPKGVELRLVRIREGGDVYIEISDTSLQVLHLLQNINPNFVTPFPFPDVKFLPLQQPFLNLMYEHVNDELEKLNHIDFENLENIFDDTKILIKDELLKLKQQLWYEIMASTPRTLQHCCRLSIRKCMGPSNMKNISKLPLPKRLLSYGLFEYDE